MIPLALVRNWKLIAGGIAIVAVAGTIGYLRWQLNDARSERNDAYELVGQKDAAIATLEQAIKTQAAYVAAVEENAKKSINAMQRTLDAKEKALDESNAIIRSLKNVPETPLSPVLLCYLEQLWQLEATGEDLRAGEGVREAGSASAADRVQAACLTGP